MGIKTIAILVIVGFVGVNYVNGFCNLGKSYNNGCTDCHCKEEPNGNRVQECDPIPPEKMPCMTDPIPLPKEFVRQCVVGQKYNDGCNECECVEYALTGTKVECGMKHCPDLKEYTPAPKEFWKE